MDIELLVGGFLAAAIRVATPLLLAATGETITERSEAQRLAAVEQLVR